ncbi:MAG: hypothetical protein KA436_07050 [Oligoflexales bacterium]|nr:hypothetical protein [Oligoflexales bacterium]
MSAAKPTVYAIDFGTSNSLLAAANRDGVFAPIVLDAAAADPTVMRSAVFSLSCYERRKPEETILYQTLASHLNTFLAHLAAEGKAIPKHVGKELWAFLECGVLAYGFVRLKCEDCLGSIW